jgi:hypothetical protein
MLIPEGMQIPWASPDAIAAAVTCLALWTASSFLR